MRLNLSNIKAFPTVAISLLLALTLCFFGIYVIIPTDWLGLPTTTVYPNLIVRSIFGIFMALPAIPIIYCNIKYSLKTLVKTKLKKIRPYVFWMAVTYFYLTTLRILIVGLFPPIWLLYLTLGLISMIIWFANKYM